MWKRNSRIFQPKTRSINQNKVQRSKGSSALLERRPFFLNVPSDKDDSLEGLQLAQGAEMQDSQAKQALPVEVGSSSAARSWIFKKVVREPAVTLTSTL